MPRSRNVASLDDLRLMTRVAYLYYNNKQKQSIIAHQLDLSQATVSRLLRRAEEAGIVRISVNMLAGIYTELENDLCARYGLKAAIVVHVDNDVDDLIAHHIGSAAAYYVETTLATHEVVGLSAWSTVLLAMVNALHPFGKPSHARVVQVLGGLGSPSAEIYSSRLTDRFANLVQGEAIHLLAPAVANSSKMRKALQCDPFIKEALGLFDEVTLALVGIGSMETYKLLASSGNAFSESDLDTLREAGAVGDICLRFFDAEGQPVAISLDKRVMSMSLPQMKAAKRCVGIAGGPHKTEAIRGALLGNWINVLVTDQNTAQRLLLE